MLNRYFGTLSRCTTYFLSSRFNPFSTQGNRLFGGLAGCFKRVGLKLKRCCFLHGHGLPIHWHSQ